MNPPTEWTDRGYWSELTVGVEPWRLQADGPAVAIRKAIRHAIRELLRFRAPWN